jgi:hypothetical protein
MIASDRACTPSPPLNFHGKEEVDGSSPSEGFGKTPVNGLVCCLLWRVGCARVRDGYTFPGLAGARGQARRLASPCDTPHKRDDAARSPESLCIRACTVALMGESLTPSLGGRGSALGTLG